jgi:ABC-type Fe3+-siderophore transport system permease subunit
MSVTTRERTAARPAWPWLILVAFGVTILWALRFAVAYLLVPTACLVGDWLLHVIGAATIVASVAVLLLNVAWARRPLELPVRFFLLVGVGLNAFFLAVTVLESSAVFFVDACAKGAIP